MHGLIRVNISVSFAFSVAVPFNEKERCNVNDKRNVAVRHEKILISLKSNISKTCMTNVENHADLFFIIFVIVCQSQCSYQTARKRHNSSIYCKSGNFRENFIFANSVKKHNCDAKIRDKAMICVYW